MYKFKAMCPIDSLLLAIIGSILLVGKAIAKEVIDDGTLIDHPPARNILSGNQLLEILKTFDYHLSPSMNTCEEVAYFLYITKAKSHTKVVGGVTVSKLIDLNHIQLTDCKQSVLRERADVVSRTAPTRWYDRGVTHWINVYALKCLHLAAGYCVEHKGEVLSMLISGRDWMNGLEQAWTRHENEVGLSYETIVARRLTTAVEDFLMHEPIDTLA